MNKYLLKTQSIMGFGAWVMRHWEIQQQTAGYWSSLEFEGRNTSLGGECQDQGRNEGRILSPGHRFKE